MCKGEALALTWPDINFQTKQLTLPKQLVFASQKNQMHNPTNQVCGPLGLQRDTI
ncbi:MAG: hypothetical protein ABF478_01695 [Liquorilactobacillus satsumensis]|uniref:hypothetical protein n=1 Tax=Liquorilactobacillus satsumensis TaxID=259059 RepID=UPI0039ED7408